MISNVKQSAGPRGAKLGKIASAAALVAGALMLTPDAAMAQGHSGGGGHGGSGGGGGYHGGAAADIAAGMAEAGMAEAGVAVITEVGAAGVAAFTRASASVLVTMPSMIHSGPMARTGTMSTGQSMRVRGMGLLRDMPPTGMGLPLRAMALLRKVTGRRRARPRLRKVPVCRPTTAGVSIAGRSASRTEPVIAPICSRRPPTCKPPRSWAELM